MINYVAGLLFNEDGSEVVLIHKQKPSWQKNRFNAIGGKVEEGETAIAAMHREFREETGVDGVRWNETVILEGRDWKVTFFHAFGNPYACEQQEGEIEWPMVMETSEALKSPQVIPNLKVIIPIALDNTGINKPVYMYDFS